MRLRRRKMILETGRKYDMDAMLVEGWTRDGTGYRMADYFDGDGVYLGPDDHGNEPVFFAAGYRGMALLAQGDDGTFWVADLGRWMTLNEIDDYLAEREQWEVIDLHTGKVMGSYPYKERARRKALRLNNEYGDHYGIRQYPEESEEL
jgi:hypothetical protein